MSWTDDEGYSDYDLEDLEQLEKFYVAENRKICKECGCNVIKVNKAGDEYCSDLCWTKKLNSDNSS